MVRVRDAVVRRRPAGGHGLLVPLGLVLGLLPAACSGDAAPGADGGVPDRSVAGEGGTPDSGDGAVADRSVPDAGPPQVAPAATPAEVKSGA